MIEALWLAARAAAYVLVVQASGALIFLALFAPHAGAAAAAIAGTARRVAVAALLVCLVQGLLEPAYMAGEASGIVDSALWRMLLRSSVAWEYGLRTLGMVCVVVCLGRLPPTRVRAALALGAVLASFVLAGHSANSPARALLSPLLVLHVLAAAFWFGALWPLQQLARRLQPVPLAALLGDFSHLAVWFVPLLGLAGIAMACLLLPGIAAVRTAYGLLLCGKLVLFSGLMGLAALNRLRLTPPLARGSVTARRVLQRSLAAEYAALTLVLCLTAVLTGAYSPAGH